MPDIFADPHSEPPDSFSAALETFLDPTNPSSPSETAIHIVATVMSCSDAGQAIWELWDALFIAATTIPTSHAPLLSLLDAIHLHEPTEPRFKRAREQMSRNYTQADWQIHWNTLPMFGGSWREMYGCLESHRNREAAPRRPHVDPAECYFRFCVFSAAFVKATNGKAESCPMQIFYHCKEVLETTGLQTRKQEGPYRSPEQVWALDVLVVAIWLRDGGRALWDMDYLELREQWAGALDQRTELWPNEDGLTRGRWQLWEDRLRVLSREEEKLGEETRALVLEAADAVKNLLEGYPSRDVESPLM